MYLKFCDRCSIEEIQGITSNVVPCQGHQNISFPQMMQNTFAWINAKYFCHEMTLIWLMLSFFPQGNPRLKVTVKLISCIRLLQPQRTIQFMEFSSGKNAAVGSLSVLQIFPTQGIELANQLYFLNYCCLWQLFLY